MYAGLIWLAGAALLALGELAVGEMFLLMLAGGAIGGGAAALLGAPVWGQAIVFALLSVVLVAGVRPLARRRLLAGLSETDTNTAALTGREAVVVEPIGAGGGLVEIGGDTWTARALFEHEGFDYGERVLVHEIRGATALVVRAG